MTTTDYTLDGSSIVVTVNEDETYDGTAASNWHGYSIWKDEETDEEDNVKVRCAGSDPVVMALTEQGVGMGAIWYGGHLDQGSSEYDDEGMNNAH